MDMNLSGLKAYRWQRFSAYGLALYFPAVLLYFYLTPIHNHTQLIQALSAPVFLIPTLFILALTLMHLWVGIRDILMDYLPQFFHAKWLSPALTLWATCIGLIAADLIYLILTLIHNAS